MEHFVIIVNDFHPLTIMTKGSNLDVAALLDPPLSVSSQWKNKIKEDVCRSEIKKSN